MTRMMTRYASSMLFLLLLLTSSCSDDRKKSGDIPLTLHLKGRVNAPANVVGSTIEFYSVGEDQRRLVTSVIANPSGAFEAAIDGLLQSEPLLVCTGGAGKATDSWTGKSFSIPESQPLCAIFNVSDALDEELLVIDPWSTLAFGLAEGYRSFGSKRGIANTAWTSVIPKAAERLATHLSAETPPSIGVTDPADPAVETLWAPSARMASGVGAAALARMANGWPVEPGRVALTMPELLYALVADARDGLFDGLTVDEVGNPVEVELGASVLSSQTLRHDLASAIHDLVTQTETTFADGVDAVAAFNAVDGWYQQLSMARGALFPDDSTILFDPVPPAIELGPQLPGEDDLLVSADVLNLQITASDPHGVEALWVSSPDDFSDLTGQPVGDNKTFSLALDFDPVGFAGKKVFFRIHARDISGNEDSVDRTFRVSLASPIIEEVQPLSEVCLETPPEELLVLASHPDGLEITVALEFLGGKTHCTAKSDGFHHCPVTLVDGTEVTIIASDLLGRTDEVSWTLCVDALPPIITFDPPGGGWYGPDDPMVAVTVEDEHEVEVLSLTVNEVEIEAIAKSGVTVVELPTFEGTEEAIVEVSAADIAAHLTSASATYLFDSSPPDIQASELGIITNSFDLIEYKFRVLDAESGVASVQIIGGQGIWSMDVEGSWYVLVGTVVPQPGVPASVTVEAEDMVGNKSSRVLVVFLDSSTPTIVQAPSFVTDDATVSPVYDALSGEVDYLPEGAALVSLNKNSCADICPPFSKYAPLLFGDSVPDELSQAVPSLSFTISDPCPTGAIKATLTVEANWYAGDELLHAAPAVEADCLGDNVTIPLLLPLSDDGIGELPGSLVPDRLRLEVTDLGGQVASREVFLEMTVLPPPLFLLDDAADQPEDPIDLFLTPAAPALHQALEGGTYFRRMLLNPTTVSATVTVESLPLESLLISHARIYVQADGPQGTACAIGKCRHLGGPGDGECTAPQSSAVDTWYANSSQQVRLRHVPTEGEPALVLAGNSFAVGADTWCYLDVMTGVPEQPLLLEEAVTVALENGDGQHVHLVSTDVWDVACTWNAGFPPEVSYYEAPDIVTGYALQIKAAATLAFKVAMVGASGDSQWVAPVESLIKSYTPPFVLPLAPW